ncbi:hypothetical protein HJG54_19665 [Leptolyngbya sp. NK1-12]|uniref:Uncharacterized protein n=1 Tax=Leptolyngbya sp. NK1-12 TaxID=2547451 RepID=A0AA96WM57_9CYAN|nr:hypothetical protein [Leptolyngbya sp. NK1-12]WNZ24846.1 hypothetical protein HJG54_19665 [Leptolyngbya sp. NK1-12]
MADMSLWPQLGTRTRRAIIRTKTRFGRPYDYRPRGSLLERLARDNNLTIDEVYERLMAIRTYLLSTGTKG